MAGAVTTRVVFISAKFDQCQMIGSDMPRSDFQHANFIGTKLGNDMSEPYFEPKDGKLQGNHRNN